MATSAAVVRETRLRARSEGMEIEGIPESGVAIPGIPS